MGHLRVTKVADRLARVTARCGRGGDGDITAMVNRVVDDCSSQDELLVVTGSPLYGDDVGQHVVNIVVT